MAADPTTDRQERAARNQSLFREVNERLEATMSELSMFHDFICECATAECAENISMTHDEYNEVRRSGTRFAVKPGHIVPEVERVVDGGTAGRYVVVEKIEKAGQIAAHFDPRRRTKT